MSKILILLSFGLLLGLTHFVNCREDEQHMAIDNAEQQVDIAVAAAVPEVVPIVNAENATEDQGIVAAPAKTEIWKGEESDLKSHVRVARQFFYPVPFFGPPPLRFYGGGGGYYGGGYYGRRPYGRRTYGGYYGGRRFIRRRRYYG